MTTEICITYELCTMKGGGAQPFPKQAWFLRVCCRSLLKTLWEKEKLLVKSNFSFSHDVFYLFGELSDTFMQFEVSSANSFNLEE